MQLTCRTIILSDSDGVSLWSRQGKELSRIFPELCAAVRFQVPPGVVLDGEAVVWNGDRLDFEALQRRMVSSRAALPALVHELPASFAAFDVLAVAGQDIRGVPFTGRRQLLEELARDWAAPLNLSPTTTDMEVAKTWLRDLPATGVEGLVFKSGSEPYPAGLRSWLKLKTKSTLDTICSLAMSCVLHRAFKRSVVLSGHGRICGRYVVAALHGEFFPGNR